MVKSIVNDVETYYVLTRYYYAAGQRIAMNTKVNSGDPVLTWLSGDHLGSTSLALALHHNPPE